MNYELCGSWFTDTWLNGGEEDSYCSTQWNSYIESWVATNEGIPNYQSNYETASGAVSMFTLIDAIKQAYADRDHMPSVFDSTLVRDQLNVYRGTTFFGAMEFNGIQRNFAKDAVAVQYLPSDNDPDTFEKVVIYPADGRQKPHQYPITGDNPSTDLNPWDVSGAGCLDTLATNYAAGSAGSDDCVYSLKIGATLWEGYHADYGVQAAVDQLNDVGLVLGSNGVKYR